MDEKRLNIKSMLHRNIGNDKHTILSSPSPAFLSLNERQRTNSYEDLFTATSNTKGDVGSVTDIKTGWQSRSNSVLSEIGTPRKGWSKRTKLLIALAIFVVVIVALCAYLAVATIGKNGSGDSSAGKFEVQHHSIASTIAWVQSSIF